MAKQKNTTPKECAVTREQFEQAAKPITVVVNGTTTLLAGVKKFSTGGLGWFAGEKVVVMIGDTPVKVQVTMSLVVVNSKEAK